MSYLMHGIGPSIRVERPTDEEIDKVSVDSERAVLPTPSQQRQQSDTTESRPKRSLSSGMTYYCDYLKKTLQFKTSCKDDCG